MEQLDPKEKIEIEEDEKEDDYWTEYYNGCFEGGYYECYGANHTDFWGQP